MVDKSIKSVRRVFEVLELFDKERRPLAAKDIARRLDYPLTSAHALLKSMHELGYADFYAESWSYTPSSRLPALVGWVQDFLERETRLLEFMAALNRETRETVNISRRIDSHVKIIHGFESLHTVGISVKVGTLMPTTNSLTGIALLAVLAQDNPESADSIETFFAGLQKSDPDQFAALDRNIIDAAISETQKLGMVTRSDLYVQGIGAVCVPVRTITGEPLVIGVVGPSDRVSTNASKYCESIRKLATEHRIKTCFRLRKT